MVFLNNLPFFKKGPLLFFRSHSPEITLELGQKLGYLLQKGDFVALTGELGAGKTTFVKGVVSAYGLSDMVKSPSFILLNEYQLKEDLKLFHLDFYRADVTALDDVGWTDLLAGGIVVVEWPEKIAQFIPGTALVVRLEFIDENSRNIYFYGADIWKERLSKLRTEK